jgi:hypothetical protein
MTENEPRDPTVDDLGLTSQDWNYLQFAYHLGTLEPAPGTVDEEAFRRMDEYALREVERAAEEADEVWGASRHCCEPQAGLEPEAGQ